MEPTWFSRWQKASSLEKFLGPDKNPGPDFGPLHGWAILWTLLGVFAGGIAVTNSLIGVFAALTGGLMGALLQHPAVLIIIAALLTALAFSLFGFWELRVPCGLMQAVTGSRAGYLGSFFMGLAMGIVAAPCIGPFVLGLLTWVASMGSPCCRSSSGLDRQDKGKV